MSTSEQDKKIDADMFGKVERAINDMLIAGVKPTQRAVRDVTGGRTETITQMYNAVFKKRDLETAKIADEVGSSEIGRLIASTINDMVIKKTVSLQQQVEQKVAQLDELNELMQEKEDQCQSAIELMRIDCEGRLAKLTAERDKALDSAQQATHDKNKAQEDAKAEIANAISASEQAITKSEAQVISEQQKAETLVSSAKSEASALVSATEKRLATADAEVAQLRAQLKEYTLNEAKYALEKEQFQVATNTVNQVQAALSDAKTDAVRLSTENTNYQKDVQRLNEEVKRLGSQLEKSSDAQVMLIESQKTIAQLQHQLNASEKQRESLSQALASNQYRDSGNTR